MESENSIPPAVKQSDAESEKKSRRRTGKISAADVRDRRTFSNFLRIEGYLNGAFVDRSRGKLEYFDFDVERFHRKTKTKGKKAIAVRTLERVLPDFARWTDSYRMERVNVSGRWVRRFMPRNGVQLAVKGATIRERLQAAIRSYVAKGGRCRVDHAFCAKFASLSGLPLVAVESLWLRLPKFAEFKCRWRGQGRGRRLEVEQPERWAAVLVERERAAAEICAERAERIKSGKFESSDPQTSPPVSISFGNERFQNSGLAPGGPEEIARAAPANEDASDQPARETRPNAEPGGCKTHRKGPPFDRARTAFPPLHICDRFVSRRKLRNFATWIAGARLKFAHVNRERVGWVFAFGQKFAFEALCAGYRADVIERAYALGVARSNEDALDKDRLEDGGYAITRLPSAAVHYAWQKLRGDDPRTPEQLWQEFFDAPRRAKLTPHGPAAKVADVGIHARSAETKRRLEQLRELRRTVTDQAAPTGGASQLSVGELAEYLKTKCDMTMAQFAALTYRAKASFIRGATRWRADRKAMPGEKFLDRD